MSPSFFPLAICKSSHFHTPLKTLKPLPGADCKPVLAIFYPLTLEKSLFLKPINNFSLKNGEARQSIASRKEKFDNNLVARKDQWMG